jgi:hypothetical protein
MFLTVDETELPKELSERITPMMTTARTVAYSEEAAPASLRSRRGAPTGSDREFGCFLFLAFMFPSFVRTVRGHDRVPRGSHQTAASYSFRCAVTLRGRVRVL